MATVPTTTIHCTASVLDNAINSILDDDDDYNEAEDEYKEWKKEPKWSAAEYEHSHAPNPVQYWISREKKYPHLSQFAIDMMTIPASSCECERLFSELGDLLEQKDARLALNYLRLYSVSRRGIELDFHSQQKRTSTKS